MMKEIAETRNKQYTEKTSAIQEDIKKERDDFLAIIEQ